MGRERTHPAVATAAVLMVVLALMLVMTASAVAGDWSWSQAHSVFVQTDDPSANHIVVYDRACDGTPQPGRQLCHRRQGRGGSRLGRGPARLAGFACHAPTHGRLLLAVNAGSDTLSLFRVHGDHLWLRQVIASGGDFPVSIAVHRHLVYVLNAGGDGSVQGYWLWDGHLWPIRGSHRCARPGERQPARFPALARGGRLHPRWPSTHRDHQAQRQRHRRLPGPRFRQAEQRAGLQPLGDAGALCLHLRPLGSAGRRRGRR